MARRKQASPAEDLTDLVSLLPWWAGVVLALVFYIVLHRVAAQQVIASAAPGQIGNVVRELYGVMAAKGAAGGFVVTSGRFTEEATHFASGRNVQLIDGPKLHGLIRQVQAVRDQSQGSGASVAPMREQAVSTPAAVPMCPACAKSMVKRTAKRGANAGGEFWGCTGYPACKGVRRLA